MCVLFRRYDIAWALLFRGQKTGLSNTAKLSVSTLFFFALFTYSHESWAIAERMLSKYKPLRYNFCNDSTGDPLQQNAQLLNS